MKTNSRSESGIFSVRLLFAVTFCSLGMWLAWASVAATPGKRLNKTPAAPLAPTGLITVTTTAQKISDSGGCSLQEAIYSSEYHSNIAADAPGHFITTQCTPGTGDDTIVLPSGAVFQFDHIIDDSQNSMGPTANPVINSHIVIEANGSRFEHVPNGINFRAFAINPGESLTIRNAHIKGFTVKGGDGRSGGGGGLGAGGAIYVQEGNLTIESSTFEGNGAVGGNGSGNPSSDTGGGGGGLAGNGGPRGLSVGGGGGGSRGDGRFGGGGTVTSAMGNSAGFSCGGDGGGAILIDGQDGTCRGGGGGGGGESITIFTSGGDGGNGAYGGGGGGGGAGEDDGSGGNGDFGGGGGSGGTLKSNLDGFGPTGGDGGFGGGGGAAIGGFIQGGPGRGGNFAGNGGRSGGGGGAALGGAIFNDGGTILILNSTFTRNFVDRGVSGGGKEAQNGTDAGGAIFSRNGSTAIFNSTISLNESTGSLGGVIVISDGPDTNFELRNTIIAHNGVTSDGINFSGPNECAASGVSLTKTGSGNLIIPDMQDNAVETCPGVVSLADPQLGPLQINPPGSTPTMAIDMNSPAFDAGDDTHPPSYPFDQRGVPRPQFAHIDIGAYEFAACNDIICPADITQSNDAGQCGAVVTYSAPTGDGSNCGTISCSPASGSFFAIGTTAVTCDSTAGPTCSFNVTVNDTEIPTLTTPPNVSVSNDPGQCSASVNPGTATAGDNCPNATVNAVRSDGLALNAPYPVGVTTITWTATDAHGNASAPATQTVTVNDTQPPSVTNVSASPSVLWPPDHTMRAVTINYDAVDNCSAVNCTLSVTSNELINATGSGNTAPDWQIIDAHHVLLRAERSGNGSGRIYTISITCVDGAGNTTVKTTKVRVPKDQANRAGKSKKK